jgi:putative molybdopterin biosynthesis protein
VALGIAAAARGCGLEFLPLFRERYEFVMPRANHRRKAFLPLLKTMSSDEYRAVIDKMGGYDTTETGRVRYL